MATGYAVTAPYITPKVKDRNGTWIVQGYYAGAVISSDDIEEASLKHHLDSGMVAKVGTDEAKADGVPAGTPKADEPPNVPVAGAAPAPEAAPVKATTPKAKA